MSKKKHKDKECNECKRKRSESNHCKGCACDQLKRLQTLTEVDVFLKGNPDPLEDVVFVTFDRENCCAFFNDSPEGEPGSVIVVDCQDISAIRFEAD